MQCLEVSGAVRPIYGSLDVKWLRSSSSCLHRIPCLPVTSILPSMFTSMACQKAVLTQGATTPVGVPNCTAVTQTLLIKHICILRKFKCKCYLKRNRFTETRRPDELHEIYNVQYVALPPTSLRTHRRNWWNSALNFID